MGGTFLPAWGASNFAGRVAGSRPSRYSLFERGGGCQEPMVFVSGSFTAALRNVQGVKSTGRG
jgi:hypothetical protein